MKAAAIAFVTGMFAGILYGLLGVHSPAPPLVGLTGLLGIVAGELAAQRSRSALHRRIDRGISDQRPSGA
jgi:XapX domain-containing protein